MKLDQKLYDAAVALIEERYGKNADDGAAAMYTETGKILTSTAPEALNDGVSLCHETGALCEAYKMGEKIIASICVYQDENGKNIVLSPCGVCQERLFIYGGELEVGIYDEKSSTGWSSKKLKELQPYYWRNAFE